MKKINADENGNKLMLEKFKNLNLTHVFSIDEKYSMYMHSVDVRGNGIKNLYSFLKGLDEKNMRYIVVSDYPVNYCCRTFDKEKMDSIYLVKELLFNETMFSLNGRVIQVKKEVLQDFDKEKYEEFYKTYLELEQIYSECPCDCIYLKKCDDSNVYVVKSGYCVLEPKRLLVDNILYVILSLQRFYGSKRYFDEIFKANMFVGFNSPYFCSGNGKRKDLYVKGNFESDLFELMGGFNYPYGTYH